MKRSVIVAALATLHGVAGCRGVKTYLDDRLPPPARVALTQPAAPGAVVPAAAQVPAAPPPAAVDEFVRFAVERNPRLARAAIAIDAAQGRYVQAGLYPNPDLAVNWDEIGDRSSPDRLGILTAPRISQTIVTGGKLSLAQAVAAREIDQATLDLIAERYGVIASVRAAFFQALAAQERVAILRELVKLADESVAQGKTLLEAQRIARLDLLEIEAQGERFRAEADATAKELPGLYARLAATAGDAALPVAAVSGSLDDLPAYDLDPVRAAVLATHPEVRSARVAVERAQAAVRRAEAEPIPDVTVYGAYIRQFQNRSHDGAVGVSLPVPLWNRNQGNIRAARAEFGMAVQNVGRVENDLAARVAAAFQTYSSARGRAERYRQQVVPRAVEARRLALEAFRGGQFDYLRVLQAQRTVAEAKLELNRSLAEAWRAAAELSGLLLEEVWPGPLAVPEKPKPHPGPEEAPQHRPRPE
jgi:cobalt-zinc-cadmium efflux system outer membrane protein